MTPAPSLPQTWSKHNPATGEVLQHVAMATPGEIVAVVQQAQTHFLTWKETSLKQRTHVLTTVADRLQHGADLLARQVSLETGKPLRDAYLGDLLPALRHLRFLVQQGPAILKPHPAPWDRALLLGRRSFFSHAPHGVVAVISPWNYPLAISTIGIATALMAGNSVILKPSEETPETGAVLVRLFQEALRRHGHSPEIVQCLQGPGEIGARLLNTEGVDFACFTGSNTTGQQVQAAMQARGKASNLECGGSDAAIVLEGGLPDTQAIDTVASAILWGRFVNAGQSCAAIKRVLVHRQHHDNLVQTLQEKIKTLHVGSPEDPQTQMGPLITEEQRERISAQVQDALAQGATLITGGDALEGPGYFYAPTLLTHVPATARILTEETFGPVLPVIRFESAEEAITLANESPLGLSASVFGPSEAAQAVADQLDVGMVTVNDLTMPTFSVPTLPWTGWKASGPGLSQGAAGLLALTRLKIKTTHVLAHQPPFAKPPWHFPHQPDLPFVKALFNAMAHPLWLALLHPRMLWQLWQNRSKTRL